MMEKKTFVVSGMKCEHCKATVEKTLNDMDGVHEVTARLEPGEVTIAYEAEKVTPEAMRDAVAGAGYELKLN